MNEDEANGSDQEIDEGQFAPLRRRLQGLRRNRQVAHNEMQRVQLMNQQLRDMQDELLGDLMNIEPNILDVDYEDDSLSASDADEIDEVVEIDDSDSESSEGGDSDETSEPLDAVEPPNDPEPPNAVEPANNPDQPNEPGQDAERPLTPNRALGEQEQQQPNESVATATTPSQPNKRKRLSGAVVDVTGTPVAKANDDETDDGMTCPICLESWEMSGDHRLVSLRCGHLFGESCIRRWLIESQRQSSVKVCPQCKTKANTRDIRHLYAKRLRAIDRTEEHEMRRDLDSARHHVQSLKTELATVKMEHSLTTSHFKSLQLEYDRMKAMVLAGRGHNIFDDTGRITDLNKLARHRLYMEKNFEISRESGCRVMIYSSVRSMLVASQKSSQSLFPGYGLRFIDPMTFKPLNFMHTSAMVVHDVAFSDSQYMLSVASREPRIKTFDPRLRVCCASVSAFDRPLWSCAVDRGSREHFLYAGDLRGAVYVFDVRFPDIMLSEFQSHDNLSPVINVAAVPAGDTFQHGGFLVCQLTALKFFEYVNETALPTRLKVEGPFLSMQYDVVQETILISSRSNEKYQQSRFILAKLLKVDGVPVISVMTTVLGSPATPYMTRPTQLGVPDNTLIVGYLQDSKQLMMYDVKREERVQTMPVNEVVFDICPVSTSAGSYLAALTDNKCRIYKVNSSSI